MKTNHNEEMAHEDADLTNNLPFYALTPEDRDEEEEEEDEDNDDDGDWGDIDPAGGDAPTSPGSAV